MLQSLNNLSVDRNECIVICLLRARTHLGSHLQKQALEDKQKRLECRDSVSASHEASHHLWSALRYSHNPSSRILDESRGHVHAGLLRIPERPPLFESLQQRVQIQGVLCRLLPWLWGGPYMLLHSRLLFLNFKQTWGRHISTGIVCEFLHGLPHLAKLNYIHACKTIFRTVNLPLLLIQLVVDLWSCKNAAGNS